MVNITEVNDETTTSRMEQLNRNMNQDGWIEVRGNDILLKVRLRKIESKQTNKTNKTQNGITRPCILSPS